MAMASVQGKNANDYVFTRDNGKRVRTFRKIWTNVCERAGVPNLMLHDLRRSGARNLRRLGVGETVAMKIGGWKTKSVFARYDIVSESDLAEAAKLLDAKREELAKASEFRHSSGTVGEFPAPEGTKSVHPVLN
jgi:integrase